MGAIRLDDMLAEMVERNSSDMFIKAGVPPHMRLDGKIVTMDYDELSMDDVQALAYSLMTEEQINRFEKIPEMDLAMGVRGVGRFRVNLFRQRGSIGMVFRHIKTPTFNFQDLHLPDTVRQLSDRVRGLVLVTGTTGSGKSTTLAAMINHINESRKAHIVTIEDPIEFLHQDKMSIVCQREVGFDTKTFQDALRHVLRQSPDVILVGEMRDLETVSTSLAAAETGHLVFSTLHTMDAVQTVERIINFYPAYLHAQIRMEMSLGLQGVVSQRLLPRKRGMGRVPAIEILVNSPLIKKLLHEGKTLELLQTIEASGSWGMQSFNQSLFMLIQENLVNVEDAMLYATSPEELRLMIDGITSGSGNRFINPADNMGLQATPIPIQGRSSSTAVRRPGSS
ncbi:MAG: PilT/PilU family type 4a pilus ATPase [Candidatus Sumerlaeia bacterium]|nr:PilT/PilU family type 4a pilus ATPase [Candidatus Sumerlaeia bacterium]